MGESENQKALEEALLAREAERRDALISDDMDRLADLVTEDLVHVHTTGNVHGKAELIGHAGSFLQFLDVQRGPLTIRRLCADAAVMTGAMTNIVCRRGQDERVTVNVFVTQVWVLREGRWQITSFHAVRLPEAA
jgi:ketosteroid isomerase-like protein